MINGYNVDTAQLDIAIAALPNDCQYAISTHWPRVIAQSADKARALGDAATETFGLVRRGILAKAIGVDLVCLWAESHGLAEEAALQAINRAETPPEGAVSKSHGWRERRTNAAELQKMTFPPMNYVLPGLIPEGVALLVARPKIGKSWLALDLAIAAAASRFTLGTLKPATGDVLYLALEDSKRRLQRRMTKLLPTFNSTWPDRLELHTEWRRADQGGLDDLAEWCGTVKEPRLIIIDTLEKFRPAETGGKNRRPFGLDYEALGGLQRFAAERPGLAIIVIHHDKKAETEDAFDSISGTLGLNAAADTLIMLKKNKTGTTLHCQGRDIESSEKVIQWDKASCRWTILSELQSLQLAPDRTKILEALQSEGGPLSVSELQEAAGHESRATTDVVLGRMVKDDQIVRAGRGKYGLPVDQSPALDELDVRSGW